MKKEKFLRKYNLLRQELFTNYDELEKLVKKVLEEEGIKFFIKSNLRYILGKFESTLPQFCEACEKSIANINRGMLLYLFLTYIHLNDNKNAKRIRKLLSDKGFDKKFPYILDGIKNFQLGNDIIEGKIIIGRYDKKISGLGKYLLSDMERIENFLMKQFSNHLPKRIFITLVNGHRGALPNSLLNEIFIKVGIYNKSKFALNFLSSTIVHEFAHIYASNYVIFHITRNENGSFGLINECYAEMKRIEYLNKRDEYKIYAKNCAYHMLKSDLFELDDLLEKFYKVVFDLKTFPIFATVTSFFYFLEDRFGYNIVNQIFSAIPNYPNAKSWTEYLDFYFPKNLASLLAEWENEVFKNNLLPKNSNERIITYLKVEEMNDNETILYYESLYHLAVWDNFFIYSEGKFLLRNEVLKHKFLKRGKIKIELPRPTNNLEFFVHFLQYSQHFEFNLGDNEILL